VSLTELMSRRLDDVRLAAMMIDGIDLGERTNVVALGITTEGAKIPLGLWEGSTENASVSTALLSDLVERGLDPEQGILFVIDGAKALRKAIRAVFGQAPVQRCVRHKERNVLDHLPERERPTIRQRLRRAWALDDHARALDQLRTLASELDRSYAGAAGSLREGLEETLTLTRLGVRGNLKRTLESTNPVESMIEIVRRTQRNVKRWSSGEMALRWTAAGMLEAQRQFRKIIGYKDLATLVIAIERDNDRSPRSHRRRSHPDQGDDYARHCLTVTPRPPPRNSTASETSSLNYLFDTRSIRAIANSNHSYFDDPVYNRNLAAATRLTGPPALHVSGARNASCATRHRRHRS
jgi:transposase-like protein